MDLKLNFIHFYLLFLQTDRRTVFSGTWPNDLQNLANVLLSDYVVINSGSIDIETDHDDRQVVDVCEDGAVERR